MELVGISDAQGLRIDGNDDGLGGGSSPENVAGLPVKSALAQYTIVDVIEGGSCNEAFKPQRYGLLLHPLRVDRVQTPPLVASPQTAAHCGQRYKEHTR